MSHTLSAWAQWAICAVPLKPFVSVRARLVKYFTNTHDPFGRIIDQQGRDIARSQMEIDNWLRSEGPWFPTTYKPATLLLEQALGYIESNKYTANRDQLGIDVVTETMLESLFRRLGGGMA